LFLFTAFFCVADAEPHVDVEELTTSAGNSASESDASGMPIVRNLFEWLQSEIVIA
jgi:hypothetical protein